MTEIARVNDLTIPALKVCLDFNNDDIVSDVLWILSNIFSSEEEDDYVERVMLSTPNLLMNIIKLTENTSCLKV
jgi:hypothetical protein